MLAGGAHFPACHQMPDMRFAERSSPRLVIRSMIRVSARNSLGQASISAQSVVQNSTVHPGIYHLRIFWKQG